MDTLFPEGLKYTDDHDWLKIDGDTATLGISNFAQNALGDIVFVELPAVGASVTKGEAFGVIESIKSVTDLVSPVNGEVLECNQELEDTPDALNSAPYDSWIIKIKLKDPSEANSLKDAEGYKNYCDSN